MTRTYAQLIKSDTYRIIQVTLTDRYTYVRADDALALRLPVRLRISTHSPNTAHSKKSNSRSLRLVFSPRRDPPSLFTEKTRTRRVWYFHPLSETIAGMHSAWIGNFLRIDRDSCHVQARVSNLEN